MPAAVPKSGARQVIVQDAPESKAGAWWIQIVFCIGLLIMVCGIPEFIRTPLVKIGLLSPIHRATARHILVSEESKAQELKSEIDNRLERFEELARKHSSCPSGKQGGSLGNFAYGQMVPAFDRVIFDPEKPLHTVHGPVQTQFGYHLIWIEKRSFATKVAQGKDL